MLRLCGFHISNYHNKVRIALLEKGVPFEEDTAAKPSQSEEFLARSPVGKVPFLELGDGRRLSESHVICEYLEEAYPQKPLMPRDPFARAKMRELITYLELHVELVARRLYGEVFFGRPPQEGLKGAVEKELAKGLRGLRTLVKFDPYIAGAELTYADCAAFVHLPLVGLATKIAYGRDFIDEVPGAKDYLKRLKARPHFARVDDERKAYQAAAMAKK